MAMNGERPNKAELLKKLAQGAVPDEELRRLLRVELHRRLRWCWKPTYEEQTAETVNLVKYLVAGFSYQDDRFGQQGSPFEGNALRCMGIAAESETLNSEMYEMPHSFLRIIFGKWLKGSVCYFKDSSLTLDEAEIAMLDLYCERAELREGQRVLDLGCGQGALTLYVAQKYRISHVTAVTNSVSQKKFIEERCKDMKLSNVEVLLGDIAKLKMEAAFDRILTIGLLEHMKNYDLLLRNISGWMAPDGLLFVDHLSHKTFAYQYEPLDEEDWFTEYIFPPGSLNMLSASFLLYFQDSVSLVDHWTLSGKHFARTNGEWLKRLDASLPAALEILEPRCGCKEAALQELNYWRHFCIFGEELFGYNDGEEWMTSHLLFKK